MDPIRDAFQKIKQEIESLKQELQQLTQELTKIKQDSTQKLPIQPTNTPTDNPTPNQTITPLPTDNPTLIPTHQHSLGPLKQPNSAFSTGNRGVPTDNPTNTPTHQQTDKNNEILAYQAHFDDFEQAREILDSLDNIKKEIRLKFKRLTSQEMLVFSTIYRLEEQKIEEITHKTLSNILNLSESSIRDYINKLINKGIPIIKIRQNNRKILLKVSPDLQQIASLSTITKLREL